MKRLIRHLGGLCAAALMVAALPLGAAPATTQVSVPAGSGDIDIANRGNGTAFVIGGGLKADNDDVWIKLVEVAGGKGVAKFVVLGTASESPMLSGRLAAQNLQKRGAVAEVLPVSPLLKDTPVAEAVRDPALIAKVRSARGVYFTGGSQDRIVDSLYPDGKATPLLEAIWEVYRKGGVVAGTSAGAAIMSSVMFRDAPVVLKVMKGEWTEGKEVGRGLGFVGPTMFVDQHFLKRGRFGRMIPLMVAKGYTFGLGVEENSAAMVRGDEVEIVDGKALLVDLREAKGDPNISAFNLRGIRVSLLDGGDRVNMKTRKIVPSRIKIEGQLLDPKAADYKPYFVIEPAYTDMFGDWVIANAMIYLIDAPKREVTGIAFDHRYNQFEPNADLGFAFRLYKGQDTLGWYSDILGDENYTVSSMYLDISPVRVATPMYSPWIGPSTPAKTATPETGKTQEEPKS